MKSILLALTANLLLAPVVCADDTENPTLTSNPPTWPLLMSTYLRGSGQDGSPDFPFYLDAVEDARGNLIIATLTTSSDLPIVPGSYQCATCGGTDILIAKLSPDLTGTLAMVRFGGEGEDTYPRIALGHGGRICLLVKTASTNYPTTAGAYSRTRRGGYDFAITVFDSLLSTVLASTYFGGYGTEDRPDIVINSNGEIYISGHVDGNGVPTTSGAFQPTYAGGGTDCFVSRFSSNLDTLKASTLLGGRYSEAAGGLGLFPGGDVVLGLSTESDNFPTTPGAYSTSYHGIPVPGQNKLDCAVTRLNGTLSDIVASTYIGGTEYDGAFVLHADIDGNVWIGGSTFSLDYPVSSGAFDTAHNGPGQHEVFVTKLNGDLTQLLASTYLSPDFPVTGAPGISNIYVDASGLVYVDGTAWGSVYTTPDAYDPSFNGSEADYVVMVLSNELSHMIYSTVIGGTGFEIDSRTVSIRNGIATIVGITNSGDYPTTSNALYPNYIGGASDITVTKLGIGSLCCKGTRGNVNYTDIVDLADLSALVSFLTGGGYILPCPNEANVNGIGIVDLADLSALVSYLTGGGYILPNCM